MRLASLKQKGLKLVTFGKKIQREFIHLSSFSYVEAEEEVGTLFQALSIVEVKKVGAPKSSFKDAQKPIKVGNIDQWGRMVEIAENKNRVGLEFQPGPFNIITEVV